MKIYFIDTEYEIHLHGGMFEPSLYQDPSMALPLLRLRQAIEMSGNKIYTADRIEEFRSHFAEKFYISLGNHNRYQNLPKNINLLAIFLLEPPLVARGGYQKLPELTKIFKAVYVHNIDGDGYSLTGVDKTKLQKLYCPQPFDDVQYPWWNENNRINKVVAISGNHNPGLRKPEYYSLRIKAVAELNKYKAIDLYGRGWDRWRSRQSMWWPYWRNFIALMQTYRGSCESKIDVLSKYRFSLCLENMPMQGYITEKIFDCFYAGTIPIYLGASDIYQYIPKQSMIDVRDYNSWSELWSEISTMSESRWNQYRVAAREFIKSTSGLKFFNSLTSAILWQ